MLAETTVGDAEVSCFPGVEKDFRKVENVGVSLNEVRDKFMFMSGKDGSSQTEAETLESVMSQLDDVVLAVSSSFPTVPGARTLGVDGNFVNVVRSQVATGDEPSPLSLTGEVSRSGLARV